VLILSVISGARRLSLNIIPVGTASEVIAASPRPAATGSSGSLCVAQHNDPYVEFAFM